MNFGDISSLSALAESIEPQNLGRIAGDFSPISSSADEVQHYLMEIQ